MILTALPGWTAILHAAQQATSGTVANGEVVLSLRSIGTILEIVAYIIGAQSAVLGLILTAYWRVIDRRLAALEKGASPPLIDKLTAILPHLESITNRLDAMEAKHDA